MRKISILLIGLGGIGAPILSQLINKSNVTISYLSKEDVTEKDSRTVCIEHKNHSTPYEVKKHLHREVNACAYDLIVLSCKAHQNQYVLQSISILSNGSTLLLILQNGLGLDAELSSVNFSGISFAPEIVSSSHKSSTNTIRVAQWPVITISDYYQAYQEQYKLLLTLFNNTEIQCRIAHESPDIILWKKFAFVICISAATFKFEGPCSTILNNQSCFEYFQSLSREFSLFAKLHGIAIDSDTLVNESLNRVSKMPEGNFSSMTLDALTGQYGELLYFLKEKMLPAPINLPKFNLLANEVSESYVSYQ
jgi:2-dehydropantoate 2-reductase